MTLFLETLRLVLRSFRAEDFKWVAEALEDTDVAQWVPLMPHPYSMDDAREFVEMQSSPKANALAILFGGTPIGCITRATELGYWLSTDAWGQGFATEAAHAVVARHFKTEQHNLTSGYMLDNKRSQRVLSKLGFTPTEKVERLSTALNQMKTIQRMELSRANWQANQ